MSVLLAHLLIACSIAFASGLVTTRTRGVERLGQTPRRGPRTQWRLAHLKTNPGRLSKPSALLGTGGGGSDSGGRSNNGIVTHSGLENNDDEDGNDEKGSALTLRLSQLFKEAKVDEKVLPADIKEAFLAGRVGVEVIMNFLLAFKAPASRLLMSASTMMRDRLLMNPVFLRTLAIEIGVGVGATVFAQAQQRGEKFREQIDFVIADLSIVVAANIALVTALSPAAQIAPLATGKIASALSSLPAFVAQSGDFSLQQRVGCFLLKGAQFAALGSVASAVGQGVAKGLVDLREKLNPESSSSVQLSPILPTALNFGAYMFASSNPRYQVVNAFEQSVLPKLPGELVQTAASTAARIYNNYLGGITWIWWARWRGLQSSD